MAKFSSKATINLEVNGQQAKKMLNDLQKNAADLTEKIRKAADAGDKVSMKKWQKELKEVDRLMSQLRTESQSVAEVMARLDRATPKELNKTLSTLRRQLNNIERGSEAWNKQIEKISRVRTEINKVNDSMRAAESSGNRFMSFIENKITGFTVLFGHMLGLQSKLESFVNDYASMQAEEANVRKFTGMSEEDVRILNEQFKKLDTRNSREELNRLAQEAGRLGKTSVEDVLGFVKASTQLNVALDDLGEGATLTLSKLTGIFGVEQELGTEKSLLAVGSVINELSQNSTASAPYLAEFSKRMAGVGAQAKMTIPQIMAFAAVLDAQGQNVEASSTALSQLIMKMYKEPQKIAKVAGMDVKVFTETLKEDANKALLMLLETLNSFGGVNNLSKIFADMGTDGARATATIAALAGNIGTLRWQQDEANKAFREATSVTGEYNVQNNTRQAELDKVKKRLNEVSVSLGERLLPYLKYTISSVTMLMKAISATVGFLIEYKTVIISAAGALAAYKTGIVLASAEQKIINALDSAHNKLLAAKRILSLAYCSVVGRMSGQLSRAAAAQRSLNAAISSSAWGVVIAVIGAAFGALLRYSQKCNETAKREREAAEARRKFQREATEISKDAMETYSKEISQLKALYSAATDEAKAKEERIKAANRLIKLYPDQFSKMTAEQIMLGKAKTAYDDLTQAIINNAKAKAAADKVLENEKKILELEDELERNRSEYKDASKKRDRIRARNRVADSRAGASASSVSGAMALQGGGTSGMFARESTSEQDAAIYKAAAEIRKNKSDIAELKKANEKLSRKWSSSKAFTEKYFEEDPSKDMNIPDTDEKDYNSQTQSEKERKKKEREARAAAIKERKEFKEALAAVKAERDRAITEAMAERAVGNIDYRQYIDAEHSAKSKYFKDSAKVYEKFGLADDDDADYQALMKKRTEYETEFNRERIALSKEAIQRIAKVEEQEARAAYNAKVNKTLADEMRLQEEILRIKYNALMDQQKLHEKGSREYEQYEQQIQDLFVADREQKQKILQAKASELQKKYDKQSVLEKYEMERIALEELYKRKYISEEQYREWLKKLNKEESDEKDKMLPGGSEKLSNGNRASSSEMQNRADNARYTFEKEKEVLDEAKSKGLISDEEYAERLKNLKKALNDALIENFKGCSDQWVSMLTNMYDAWAKFAEALKNKDKNPFEALSAAVSASAAVMTAIMQQVTAYQQAQLEIQVNALEKRYDREISFAEGNSYLTKKLEKEKEEEIAKLKSEASKKQYDMQVAAAVAQTAANAIQAYGAGLAVGGLAGLILGPASAAIAVAAGAIQIATIKKQQQAAAATGYSEGGFTEPGPKDKPAGVVHAGEWVASQKLVNSPRTRPLIDALEYAQRNNTIGSISMADVSRSVAAPMMLAYSGNQQPQTVNVQLPDSSGDNTVVQKLEKTVNRLNDRLDEPFITHNTVTGPYGSKAAEDKYKKLMSNKSRRKRG